MANEPAHSNVDLVPHVGTQATRAQGHAAMKTLAKKRNDARITQTAAAAMVHSALRTWQDWEAGARMHPGLAELFDLKLLIAQHPDLQQLIKDKQKC